MKRFAILGKGSAGAISAAMAVNILHNISKSDFEIHWIYDPMTPTQAVGEGTTINVAQFLNRALGFRHTDLKKIDGNYKSGILKNGWGNGDEFIHHFLPPTITYHINAIKLQDFVFDYIKSKKNVHIIETNTTSELIDADYVIDCSGKPKEFDNRFNMVSDIPVNSVYVTQCFWDHPRFDYSLTNAAKHGWYFGIPLQNRCSIGYLYNNTISTLEEIKEDVQHVFEKYNLVPSDKTNSFSFNNYYRKKTFTERISYNGNSSFFLEPLEATTLLNVVNIAEFSTRLFSDGIIKDVCANKSNDFSKTQEEIIDMITLHYMSGSKYKTKFWEFAKEKGEKRFRNSAQQNKKLHSMLNYVMSPNYDYNKMVSYGYGTWSPFSWYDNIKGLGLENKIKSLL